MKKLILLTSLFVLLVFVSGCVSTQTTSEVKQAQTGQQDDQSVKPQVSAPEQVTGSNQPSDSDESSDNSAKNTNEPSSEQSTQATAQSSQEPDEASQGGITLEELSTHNSVSNCWVGYQGKTYDVTSYLPKHPGGVNAISRFCGKSSEFEAAFVKKHGTSKVSLFLKESDLKGDLV